ncbi:hypothetical protein I41_23960 [Lacipirellula limnantheis]|uniref:Uncharacterized protein n=1 Tax=Lacipirellula limnantheis TaxID=2528024 RepID=A0A517TXU7_9BACT|nr:hypothetical protein I41_23960 [Lacipirellula limnantheis]
MMPVTPRLWLRDLEPIQRQGSEPLTRVVVNIATLRIEFPSDRAAWLGFSSRNSAPWIMLSATSSWPVSLTFAVKLAALIGV